MPLATPRKEQREGSQSYPSGFFLVFVFCCRAGRECEMQQFELAREFQRRKRLRGLCSVIAVHSTQFEVIGGKDLDGFRGARIRHIHNIVNVVAHGDEQVEEQFPPKFHFHLHGSTALECLTAADDQR